jgi:CDP-alcohol phosphatidyltransferase
VAGGAAWSAACAAARRRSDFDPPALAGLAWWADGMADARLAPRMAEGGDGRPRARLSPADAVTLTRFWLVPALPAMARDAAALPAVVVVRGVTDWLDGAVARRQGRTRLGRDLDSTADLAFLTTAAITAHAPAGSRDTRSRRCSPVTGSGLGCRLVQSSAARDVRRSAPGRGALCWV